MFVADPGSAGTREKVVLSEAPDGMRLPFVGPISLIKGPNSLKVMSWIGIDFWLSAPPAPPSSDVIVAAWLAKHAGNKERQTAWFESCEVSVLISQHGQIELHTSVERQRNPQGPQGQDACQRNGADGWL